MFLEVAKDKSMSEYSRQRLELSLQAAWDTLDQDLFNKLGNSISDRITAIINADR